MFDDLTVEELTELAQKVHRGSDRAVNAFTYFGVGDVWWVAEFLKLSTDLFLLHSLRSAQEWGNKRLEREQ